MEGSLMVKDYNIKSSELLTELRMYEITLD